jgi:uncharacterized coiled-coil DUF342 family protein
MNKWEQLNSLLADARHYAADLKEERDSLLADVERLTAERDGLRTDLAAARAQADAIADEWQRENDKLNRCRESRDEVVVKLAAALDELASYKRNAAYIAACVDSDGCYRP